MRYYAIQDKFKGYIQFLTPAKDNISALELFSVDVALVSINVEEWDITEIKKYQFEQLPYTDGVDTAAIDLLESYSVNNEILEMAKKDTMKKLKKNISAHIDTIFPNDETPVVKSSNEPTERKE